MLWYMYMALQGNSKVHAFLVKWLGQPYAKHFARMALYFGLGIYLIHQYEKEVVEASTNKAFHFYWDILGLVMTYALLSPFFRKDTYAQLHQGRG